MSALFQVQFPAGAFGTSSAAGARNSQRLTGAASVATGALVAGRKYMIVVSSATSVRVRAGASAPTAIATDLPLAASSAFPYWPTPTTNFLAFFPDAGTCEVFVWECEGAG